MTEKSVINVHQPSDRDLTANTVVLNQCVKERHDSLSQFLPFFTLSNLLKLIIL